MSRSEVQEGALPGGGGILADCKGRAGSARAGWGPCGGGHKLELIARILKWSDFTTVCGFMASVEKLEKVWMPASSGSGAMWTGAPPLHCLLSHVSYLGAWPVMWGVRGGMGQLPGV